MKQNHYLALLFQNNIHQQTMKRTMKYTCLSLLILCLTVSAMAQPTFTYREKTIRPDKHNYLIDAALTNDVIHPDTYVFRSLKDALRAAEKQLASNQSKRRTVPGKGISLYIAPGVYWIDDPDAPEVRHPLPGEGIPYGMKLKVSNLRLIGLTDNPEEVVIASNRGQTLGAVGNFTMLHFDGDDIQAENITFGNYCNVDLIYPLNEKLNRKKRSETIVQAQLIICNSTVWWHAIAASSAASTPAPLQVHGGHCSIIATLNVPMTPFAEQVFISTVVSPFSAVSLSIARKAPGQSF